MPDDQPINPAAIETLRSLSPDDGGVFIRELIEIFLQDTPLRLNELKQARGRNDATTFVRAAHSIKGSSGNFGAARLARLAQEVEAMGKAGNLAAAEASCVSLRAEYDLVAEALTKIAQGK